MVVLRAQYVLRVCFALGQVRRASADVLMWFYLDGATKIPGGLNDPGRRTRDASPAIEPRNTRAQRHSSDTDYRCARELLDRQEHQHTDEQPCYFLLP